jgi:hypothetical protein
VKSAGPSPGDSPTGCRSRRSRRESRRSCVGCVVVGCSGFASDHHSGDRVGNAGQQCCRQVPWPLFYDHLAYHYRPARRRGFLLTGRDLLRDSRLPSDWLPDRPPLLLETSLPGVFAAGDVRTAPSSGSPQPSEKARSPSSSSTNTSGAVAAFGSTELLRSVARRPAPWVHRQRLLTTAWPRLARLTGV